jgi:hypothetical protein
MYDHVEGRVGFETFIKSTGARKVRNNDNS